MTTPALFSLVILDEATSLPEPTNGPYFVATRDGYMVHQNTHWGRVLVPTKEASSLSQPQSTLWHEINLPAELIGQAWGFFRAVYEKRKSEAMVDITWSRKRGYRLFVPPQTTSFSGVKAKRNAEHYRGQLVGTIHSHCNFNAYHSSVDTHDADGQDGLHMTIGHVDTPTLDIAIMISHATITWDLKLEEVTKNEVTIQPFPTWWLNLIKDETPNDEWPASRLPQARPAGAIVTYIPTPIKPAAPPATTTPSEDWFITQEELLEDRLGYADADDIFGRLNDLTDQLDHMGVDLDYELKLQVPGNNLHPFNIERYADS